MAERKNIKVWIGAALLVSAWSVACERPAPPAPLAEAADVGGVEDDASPDDAAAPDDASPEDASPNDASADDASPDDASPDVSDDASPDVSDDASPDVSEDVSPDVAEDVAPSCGEPGPGCPQMGEACAEGGVCSDGLSCGLDGFCGGLGARCERTTDCAEDTLCKFSQCDGYARRCIQPDRCLGPPRCDGGACADRQLSVGQGTTCLLAPNGTLGCWGDNFSDEVNVPVGRYRAVSLGIYFTCAITDTGLLRCWGDDTFSQRSPPNDVEALEMGSGSIYACARKADATVVCWGAMGDSETNLELLSAPSGAYDQLSVGWRHACVLDSSGLPRCWGDAEASAMLPTTTPLAQISAGGIHSCGLTAASREVVCWGVDDERLTARPAGGGFLAVTASIESSCAIRADHSLVCWGSAISRLKDVAIPTGAFSQVAIGGYHACALEVNGPLVCWGDVKVGP